MVQSKYVFINILHQGIQIAIGIQEIIQTFTTAQITLSLRHRAAGPSNIQPLSSYDPFWKE